MQLLSVVWYCCVTLQGDGAQCLQRQMVTQPPRELWPCPSMVVQLCTLDRTAVYSATAFAGGIGSSLIYFYFYLILGYARHPFVLVQGIHHFYNGKQSLLHLTLAQDLNWGTAVNHVTWFYRARTANLWKQHLPLHCSSSSTGANPGETFCRPAQCQPSHTSSVQPVEISWDSPMAEITRAVSCSCILEYRESPTTVQSLYFNISKQKPQTLLNYILEK